MSTEIATATGESTETREASKTHMIVSRMRTSFMNFVKEEDGLSTVEMLLLLFVGIVIIIAIMKFVFPSVWNSIKSQINALLGYGNNQTK